MKKKLNLKDNINLDKVFTNILGGSVIFTSILFFFGYISLNWYYVIVYGYTGSIFDLYSFEEVLWLIGNAFFYTIGGQLFFSGLLAHFTFTKKKYLSPLHQKWIEIILLILVVVAILFFYWKTQLVAESIHNLRWPYYHYLVVIVTTILIFLVFLSFEHKLNLPKYAVIWMKFVLIYVLVYFVFFYIGVKNIFAHSACYADLLCKEKKYENVLYIKSTNKGYLFFDSSTKKLTHLNTDEVLEIIFTQTKITGSFFR